MMATNIQNDIAVTLIKLNIIEFIKKLKNANFTQEQADVIVEIVEKQSEINQQNTIDILKSNDFATKSDLLAVKNELKAEILAVKNELKAEILAVKNELKAEILAVKNELKAEILAVKNEITDVRKDIENVEERLGTKTFRYVVGTAVVVVIALGGMIFAVAGIMAKALHLL